MTHEQRTAVELGGTGTDAPSVVSTDVPRQTTRPAGGAGQATAGGRLDGLRRHRAWVFALVVVALLSQMAVGMITAARQESPTTDEPVYVGAAVVYLQQRSLEYNFEHPPLAKLIMATGLIFAKARLDPPPGASEWQVGNNVLYQEGNDAQHLLFLARLPLIILTLLFGLVVFAFARDLVGPVGGLVALALYAFSPDVIGYGSLAGLDMPAAGFLLTTLWFLWRARRRPYLYLPLSGLALGAALATKMSTLPAVPLMLLLVIVSVWYAGRARDLGRRIERRNALRLLAAGAGAAVGVGLISVLTVWATYLVVDPRLRWTTPPDLPVLHGLAGQIVDWLPFPQPFRDGMRIQLGFEGQQFGGFLLGDQYLGSRWYYLPVALLVKEPLGMLALWVAGAVAMVVTPRLRAAAVYVLVPTAVLLLVAMAGSRDFGVRYAIFVPVFLAVAAGCVVAYRWRWSHVATAVLLVFVAVSSLRTFPHYLPYSNEAFGGPSKTYLRLGDSNVDWGQDLARLGTRLNDKYPGEQVWLVYKGRGSPSYYGIKPKDPLKAPASEVHGLLVVSASRVPTAKGQLEVLLDSSTRIDDVGHSILVYRR
jgi:hypothetical protein